MPQIDRPDVIVVGSGAGGGTAARELTRLGKSVVVLEKGKNRRPDDFLPYDELYFQDYKALRPPIATDPQIYMDPDRNYAATPYEKWWIGNMVGGSTMLWEANLPRYTAEDFQVRTVMREVPRGASMVNWPWKYEDFHEYFERAEWEWGVSGQAGQWPAPYQEPTREGYRYPMSPIRPHASTPFLMEAFRNAGMHPYLSPRGINSRTFDGRPGCPFCGYCQGYGCAVNDRASSTNTVLARALATGRCDLRPEHTVTRILHDKGKVRGVEYRTEPGGPSKQLLADKVVVSIQAIESARLFLFSGIPNPNDMIGRYLTYHTKGSAELVFKGRPVWDEGPQRIYQPRTSLGSLQLRDLYVIRDPATYLTKGGKFSIYDPFTIYPAIRLIWGMRLWGKALQERMRELREHGGVSFSFTGETLSRWENRVLLDETRVDPWGVPLPRVYYEHHQYDMDLSRYALTRVVGAMVTAGGEVRRFEPQGRTNTGYGHNHGTLRAGTDAGESVLDANCQSWDVKGLYVLDAAWMPTAGASNPGLTTIANAYRVAQRI